jgi:hypothetical protein
MVELECRSSNCNRRKIAEDEKRALCRAHTTKKTLLPSWLLLPYVLVRLRHESATKNRKD